jgi:hypothetical protein
VFNSEWEDAYFCAEQGDKPQCKHSSYRKSDKYEEATRFAMLYDLKSKLSKQKSLFLKSATNERENLTACYKVCLESVKHKYLSETEN